MGGAGRQFIAVTNVVRMSCLLDTNEKRFPFCATENPFQASEHLAGCSMK